MRNRLIVLFVILGFAFLIANIPQSLANGNISPYSITSFAQTNPADDSFWPDGAANNYSSGYQTPASSIYGWSWDSADTQDRKTSDGDVITFGFSNNGTYAQSGIWTNHPQITATTTGVYYCEFRYARNSTNVQMRLVLCTTNTGVGPYQNTSWLIPPINTYTTIRFVVTLTAVQSIIYEGIASGVNVGIKFDYLYIFPSNRGGWQHDCSSTDNTTGFSSSTGDLLYKELAPGDAVWSIDTTATTAGINSTSYSFLEINIVDDAGGNWALDANTATETYTLHSSGPGTGLFHFNLRSFSPDDFYTFTLTPGNIAYGYYIKIDWISVYNIANFTTTIIGADVNDAAYVSSNTLCITKSTAGLFQFDRDPMISVPDWPYGMWNISTSVSSAVGLSTYISPTWTTADHVTNSTMPIGTSTDVRIRVFSSCAISSIKFLDTRIWNEAGVAELWFDMPNWHTIATAILTFWTAINTVILEGLFIIAGLILIPVSTLYLVHGGREEMSNDKVFFFLVLFFVGWALLIGGIMP